MWRDLIGHRRELERLQHAVQMGKLPSAYLFTGPRGIGKHRVATGFVASLLCTEQSSPCGVCRTCRNILAARHPDVMMIGPEGDSITIDRVRLLSSQLHLHAVEAPLKLAIIDEADAMTEAAQNALLKILEEPPAATHFILITAHPHELLPTVRSRCQRMTFQPLPDAEVVRWLLTHAERNETDAERLAVMAEGSFGLAVDLDPEFIETIVDRFSAVIASRQATDILTVSEAWAKEEKASLIPDILAHLYRDRLRTQAGVPALLPGHAMLPETVPECTDQCLKRIVATKNAMATTANKQLLFEQLLFSIALISA